MAGTRKHLISSTSACKDAQHSASVTQKEWKSWSSTPGSVTLTGTHWPHVVCSLRTSPTSTLTTSILTMSTIKSGKMPKQCVKVRPSCAGTVCKSSSKHTTTTRMMCSQMCLSQLRIRAVRSFCQGRQRPPKAESIWTSLPKHSNWWRARAANQSTRSKRSKWCAEQILPPFRLKSFILSTLIPI